MVNIILYFMEKTQIITLLMSSSLIITCYLLFKPFFSKKNHSNKSSESNSKKKEKNDEKQNISETFLNTSTLFFYNLFNYLKYPNIIQKKELKILGYHILTYSSEESKFIISDLITKPLDDLSKNVFNWYKENNEQKAILNKNKEIEKMFVECIATSNSRSNHKLQKILFTEINWEIENTEIKNNDKIISYYLRYKNEESLNKKMNNGLNCMKNSIENEIIFNHYELGVVRIFNSDINDNKLTTIVKNINGKLFQIYCQGNPKDIKNICNIETLPINYEDLVNYYSSNKKEIFALAGKKMKMNFSQAMKIDKSQCEKNMIFLGLIIFDEQG